MAAAKKSKRKIEVPMPSRPTKSDEERWRAEDDARTLLRAEEIKRDKARLKRVVDVAKKQISDLNKVVKR